MKPIRHMIHAGRHRGNPSIAKVDDPCIQHDLFSGGRMEAGGGGMMPTYKITYSRGQRGSFPTEAPLELLPRRSPRRAGCACVCGCVWGDYDAGGFSCGHVRLDKKQINRCTCM